MAAPAVKGYMPLCVTPRSSVCNEQGVGQWPMWRRFDSIQGIVNQYIDEPCRDFLAMPYHEIDKLKGEELFYWYTPRKDTVYTRLSKTGDDHTYYKGIFDKTLSQYQAVAAKLQTEGKMIEASFLQLSLKFIGESEDNIYCGNGHVVATVWGMRPKQSQSTEASKLVTVLAPEVQMHTVRYDLGELGTTTNSTTLNKRYGSIIRSDQVPTVSPKEGYAFTGWDKNPVGVTVSDNLLFTAKYQELHKDPDPVKKHHVRFLTPDDVVIKELEVDDGKRIPPGDVPQLPAVNNVLCPSWDNDPLKDIVNSDRDYKALPPKEPEKPKHTVRFLTPDKRVLSQTQVEHGAKVPPVMVPPLPVVNGKLCPSWDTNPSDEIINADRDFTAKLPQTVVEVKKDDKEKELHTVRFLNFDGSEISRIEVEHGKRLQPDQIPELTTEDEDTKAKWMPDPAKQVINRDTDFKILTSQKRRWIWGGSGGGRGFWRWLLRIVLFLLLVFIVLYIMYLLDPSSH